MQVSGPVKRIGFVDYDLNNFHADVFLKAIRGPLACRGISVAGATAMQQDPSRQWAQDHELDYFNSVEALNEAVDAYMILAPSNPEVHFELCRQVLPMGKTTYVDKPFSPDLLTAHRIFGLADKHQVNIQTTSALRYTEVQRVVAQCAEPVKHMVTWAGGSTFEEYGIHPVELIISCMGPDALAVNSVGDEKHPVITILFTEGRTAVIDFNIGTHVGYAATVTTAKGTRYIPVGLDTLFVDTASAVLDFLETGEPTIARQESLMVRAILDVIADPASRSGYVQLEPNSI